jgi:formylglycine-generating enzyme required for sulfatase activity
MIGLGPKRNAPSLRQDEPVPPRADELDDIFAPDATEAVPASRSAALAANGEHGSANPGAVRTRLLLRRALSRQARAQRAHREPVARIGKPPAHKPRKKGAGDAPPVRLRRPSGLQLGIAAAVAGIVCGTALAYVANEYFTNNANFDEMNAAEGPAPPGQINPAAATLSDDLGSASASTGAKGQAGIQDASVEDDAPLPVPSGAPEEEGASPSEADSESAEEAGVAGPDMSAPAKSEAGEEQGGEASQEATTLAAVDPDAATAPARDALVPSAVETFRDCDQCPVMVKLPTAQFMMGSSQKEDGHQENESPQRAVTIARPFAIGQFEVTIADWDACVNDGGCKLKIKDEGWGRDKRPAINISWEDIKTQYLPWLSRKAGHSYRLPSEAEWEYAARATMGTDALAPSFSFGDDTGQLCAFGNGADATAKEANGGGAGFDCRDGYATTAPAGSFKPNEFGLFDVHGNVWEWVEDCWNESYANAPTDGKAWTSGDCTSRVVRGGSFNSDVPKLRSATRGWNQPSGRNRSIGFRVVREL